jgi:uroporphyrinogen decarboxylase
VKEKHTDLRGSSKDTQRRDRVNLSINFQKPDRTPLDFAAEPEVWHKMLAHFNTDSKDEVLGRLGVDCKAISFDCFCTHPEIESDGQLRGAENTRWIRTQEDGSIRDIWGARRKNVKTEFGEHLTIVSFPLAESRNTDDLRKYHWPQSSWWDFKDIDTVIERANKDTVYHIRWRVGAIFETAWSLYGFERFLTDLAIQPEMPKYVMERITEVHVENLRRVLESSADKIDMVYFFDDLASQQSLLISPQMYEQHIRGYHQQIIDTASGFGKPVMMHTCGAVFPLIERLIDMGLRALNPIQPSVEEMHPEHLAEKYAGKIAFHGGVDIQGFLPKASVEEVREKAAYLRELLGSGGGYIQAGTHHFQADTPLENILAIYGA